MLVLVRSAELQCAHVGGRVRVETEQDLVRIAGEPVIVEDDPVGWSIRGCPNMSLTHTPCTSTIAVDEGPTYSSFVRIAGDRICKDTTVGRTNWSMLGITPFSVSQAGQAFVTVSG